ncbi:50S ribosomal protein L25/general stress protein Ctc [Filibacter tadaridae]|uniref:Large ribosomal subunit protein bL25 n=1 Tax=Filibacter tadaridae TaxID=2483811 RepID=A0A3P5W6D9_9BACL|nr:50S ribosomal protein L25/general stress protein Ctc [Filibacter tadaridae]VDC18895.1 50S ribosomal protein L25 [Filibacter tadaridae]
MSTTLKSEMRETKKKSNLTQLRKEGFVPAIVYGYKMDATPVSVTENDLLKTLKVTGRNGVLKLDVDGKSVDVVLGDYQAGALKGDIRHADFLAIDMTEELEVDVQVHLVGPSIGEKEGVVVQQPNFELRIKVKPSEIPESFEVDITKLQIGETITVADIRGKSKFEILSDDDHSLVLISAPRTEQEMEELESEPSVDVDAETKVIGEKVE